MQEIGLKYRSDKITHHKYHEIFDLYLQKWYNKQGAILEIGIEAGRSMKMWPELFPNAHVFGMDIDVYFSSNNCTVIQGDQSKVEDLNKVKSAIKDKNLFFINDDGSHIPEHQLLTFNELKELSKYSKKKGLLLFATPGDFSSLKIIKKLKFPLIKISSGLITNIPLITEAAKLKKPIIISTGFATIDEINEAVKNIKKYHNKLGILRCTSLYPAKNENLNLSSINTLKNNFKHIIGYSDHTVGLYASYAALALGAKIIEKHYVDTYDRKGPDVSCSMDRNQLKELINASKLIPLSIPGEKKPISEEKVTMNFAFASVVSKKFIKKC